MVTKEAILDAVALRVCSLYGLGTTATEAKTGASMSRAVRFYKASMTLRCNIEERPGFASELRNVCYII